MSRTPFFQTSNKLKHHFLNIKRTRTCSFIDDRTRTPEFGFERTDIKHQRSSLDLLNHLSKRLEQLFLNIERT